LATGIVPIQFKIARVVPVFKGGDSTSPDNYRPIALLSNFSKILEKIVAKRLMTFFEANNILSGAQFGFRAGHSTVHPMVLLHNYVAKALDNKEHAIGIFCDLKKAFDTVDHSILLRKLSNLGVRGTELAWFRDYLFNRKQFVNINNSNSRLLEINIGVPQGSGLGPLLFLTYINDLPSCTGFLPFLFADDTNLLAQGQNIDDLVAFVNDELHKITTYFRKNKLSLHPAKTKFILFTNSNTVKQMEIKIFIDANNVRGEDLAKMTEISRVGADEEKSIRFLGLMIDPDLKYNEHCKKIRVKISSGLYFLRKARNFVNQTGMKSLYYSLVHSHLIYAIQVWSATNQSNINSLFKLQKQAIRLVFNSAYNAHTESLFKSSEILPLPKLIQYFQLQFMQQYVNGFLPIAFNDMAITREAFREFREGGAHRYLLRNNDDIYLPPARLTATEKAPFYVFPRVWASFDRHDIKIQRNKNLFNKLLKTFYLNELKNDYRCTRLLCPNCHLTVRNSSDSEE
jgi:hypothetical protein